MDKLTIPRVQVFMSTYNGMGYVKEQVDSIMNQEGCYTSILARDDGSTDGTLAVLKSLQAQYGDRISIIEGNNVGYRKSFLSMLEAANPKMNYYAYSDQDDYWESDKISRAVELLNSDKGTMLYASALKIADKDLNVQYVRKYDDLKQTLGSFFVRTRLAGCTMVFTKELLDIAKKYSNLNFASESMPDHDALLCMLSLLYDRKILIDDNAYILHRRHDSAETSGGRGLMNRIRVEIKRIRERNYSYQNTANLLMQEKKR